MKSATFLVPDEVVDCMSDARPPTVPELFTVAERIWTECEGSRSAFAWSDLRAEAPERASALRAAHVALCGSES